MIPDIEDLDFEEREEVYFEAQKRMRAWHVPGVRGQAIVEQDGIEYWVIQATLDKLRERFSNVEDDSRA